MAAGQRRKDGEQGDKIRKLHREREGPVAVTGMMLRSYRGSPTRTSCRMTKEEGLADGREGKRKRTGKDTKWVGCRTRINRAANAAKDGLCITTSEPYSKAHIHGHVQMARNFRGGSCVRVNIESVNPRPELHRYYISPTLLAYSL